MHIEKRKVGKNVKYFLSHSFREGKKVHKFRKYLGQNLQKRVLEERKKIAEKLILEEIYKYNTIKNPLQIEFSEQEMKELQNLEAQIPLKVNHLSEKQWNEFSKLFTYNTNAIEGSRLTKEEVEKILDKDQWPDKSKEDIAEAYGVDEAITFIRRTKEHLSVNLITEIHKIVFKNSKSFAGKLRKKGEEVVVMDSIGNVVHEGAPQSRIKHLFQELVRWYEKNKTKYPGLILAAVVHNQFENIHPFRDGNGRVGRILLNNILLKHHLPPLNIDLMNRFEYYASLQEYEKYNNLKPTVELFMKEYRNLKRSLNEK